jgi:hypothetical protein
MIALGEEDDAFRNLFYGAKQKTFFHTHCN